MNGDRDCRDAVLDAIMREHMDEAPPAHVDTAILAAARRAVANAPHAIESTKARQAWRWWMPLAAAAAIGVVAIGVMPLAPVSAPETPAAVSDSPASSASSDAAVHSKIDNSESADASNDQPRALRKEARSRSGAPPAPPRPAGAPPPSAPQPTPPPPSTALLAASPPSNAAVAPPPSADQLAAPPATSAPLAAREARRPMNGAAGAAALPEPAQQALRDREGPERADASSWIARIRALRAQGNAAEAAGELARFREAFDDADARLPEDLRAWAASLRRERRPAEHQ